MATKISEAYRNRDKGIHRAGNLNTARVNTVNGGAIASEDMDNFILAEIFVEDGEVMAKPLSDNSKEGYLVCSVEDVFFGEGLDEFYNAKGDRVRLVAIEKGYTRFETTNFKLDSGLSKLAGSVATYDCKEKTFVVADEKATRDGEVEAGGDSPAQKFLVVEETFNFTEPSIRLMAI